mgnify:CR=1 FL=1
MKEKCNNCLRPSKACISYLMTLSTREMFEWCRIWKDRLGWSNATLAAKSKVPKGTIDRILSLTKGELDKTDVKLVTVRPIICALTGCTLEELETCEVVNAAENTALAEKNMLMSEQLKEAKGIISVYRDQIAMYKKQIAALNKQIKDYEKKAKAL